MNTFITAAGVALIGLMLLVLIRAIKGPTVIDRLVAINVIGTKSIVLLLFAGISSNPRTLMVFAFAQKLSFSGTLQTPKCLQVIVPPWRPLP